MKKVLKGVLAALCVAGMSGSAGAGGESARVYTSYDSAPIKVQVVEPSQFIWVSSVNVNCCSCCCGSNYISVGGFAFETRADTHTLVVYQ